MPRVSRPTRAVLLTACLVTACAAADPKDSAGPAPLSMASGDFLVGRFAMGRADLNTAADNFLDAVHADPDSAELQQQAFGAAVLTGRPEALPLARKLPFSPAAQLVLGDANVKAGHWRQAEARFAAVPGQGVTQILQPLLRAWAEQGAGETDVALATLQPDLAGTRYRGLVALHAALIDDLAGRTVDAARLYRQALVEYGSLNLRLAQIEASFQARTGQQAEARATIRAGIAVAPEFAIAEPVLQQAVAVPQVRNAADGIAEAYLALAAQLRQQNGADFAFLLLRLALDLRPDFAAARVLSADMQSETGDNAGALATLAPVRPDDPLAPVAELKRAQIEDRLGQIAEARERLERLAASYPDRPEPLAELAEIERGAGKFADSAATMTRAIARSGTPGPADWSLYYERGIAYDRANEWPRAEADFLHALTLQPDEPYALNYLAYAWTEQGRNLPQARQMAERAVALRPNEGSIVDSLGWVMLRQGDTAGAVRTLERAAELDPEDATINAHLGDAYMAAGRRREAEGQWRRALVLNPDPQDVPALQAKLSDAKRGMPAAAVVRRAE